MDEIRKRTMRLPVKLTDEEKKAKHGELVEWTRVRHDNEKHLEAWLSEMKEEKKEKEAAILSAGSYATRAADIIEAGEERRDVEVTDYFDGGNIVTKRDDTGDIVSTRPADETERQMLLPEAQKDEPDQENWECQSCGATTSGDVCGACGVPRNAEPCICKSDEVADPACPQHGAEPQPSRHPADQEEEGDDGSPSEGV